MEHGAMGKGVEGGGGTGGARRVVVVVVINGIVTHNTGALLTAHAAAHDIRRDPVLRKGPGWPGRGAGPLPQR